MLATLAFYSEFGIANTSVNRGSYMGSVLLNLFNEFNKFNNTRARMLDSIYHMALRSL